MKVNDVMEIIFSFILFLPINIIEILLYLLRRRHIVIQKRWQFLLLAYCVTIVISRKIPLIGENHKIKKQKQMNGNNKKNEPGNFVQRYVEIA